MIKSRFSDREKFSTAISSYFANEKPKMLMYSLMVFQFNCIDSHHIIIVSSLSSQSAMNAANRSISNAAKPFIQTPRLNEYYIADKVKQNANE